MRFFKKIIFKYIVKNKIIFPIFEKLTCKFNFYFFAKDLKTKFILDKSELYLKSYKGKKVLLPLIETSHYKAIQLLLLAKALQLRGAEVLVLVCSEGLNICEIRSIKMKDNPNPCWKCKHNEKNLLPLFNLDSVTINSILTIEKKEQFGFESKLNKINNAETS